MLCDFCSSPNPVLRFGAQDFVTLKIAASNLTVTSEGDWAACPTCGELLAAHKIKLLAARSAVGFHAKYPQIPATVPELAQHFYEMYEVLELQLTGEISASEGTASA